MLSLRRSAVFMDHDSLFRCIRQTSPEHNLTAAFTMSCVFRSAAPAKSCDVSTVAMERGQTSRNMPAKKIGRLFWEVRLSIIVPPVESPVEESVPVGIFRSNSLSLALGGLLCSKERFDALVGAENPDEALRSAGLSSCAQYGEAALRGDSRMQSMSLSAVSSHRTGPPPISPSKRKHSGDQSEEHIDCNSEHVAKMSRLFAAQLERLRNVLRSEAWDSRRSCAVMVALELLGVPGSARSFLTFPIRLRDGIQSRTRGALFCGERALHGRM
ncbi:hypothetical protein DNTS_023039 [Danionella cerebrum]|uniref:Uncharacterized protein n=1 Tax=Danionella cerebrum TaxID=2873325 RepID=A0A553Q5A2_9TELE|nr:hypothetical protein DNTS_023039 [Danionella translucida]